MKRFPALLLVVIAVIFLSFPRPSFGQIRWHGGSWEAWKVQQGLRQFVSCTSGLIDCLRPGQRRQPTKTQRVSRFRATAATQDQYRRRWSDSMPTLAKPAGKFRLSNGSGFYIDVYDGDRYLGRIAPLVFPASVP